MKKIVNEVCYWFLAVCVLVCLLPVIILIGLCALWHWDTTPWESVETLFSAVDNAIYNKSVTT